MIGSPPLVRERHCRCRANGSSTGITPARAGKTPGDTTQAGRLQDHPRSCGKDTHSNWASSVRRGSPPLVRERPFREDDNGDASGITPARAGKTRPVRKYKNKKWDHPRSCGKDPSGCRPMPREPGSPPLVRERRFPVYGLIEQIGITPARAGKTDCITFCASSA